MQRQNTDDHSSYNIEDYITAFSAGVRQGFISIYNAAVHPVDHILVPIGSFVNDVRILHACREMGLNPDSYIAQNTLSIECLPAIDRMTERGETFKAFVDYFVAASNPEKLQVITSLVVTAAIPGTVIRGGWQMGSNYYRFRMVTNPIKYKNLNPSDLNLKDNWRITLKDFKHLEGETQHKYVVTKSGKLIVSRPIEKHQADIIKHPDLVNGDAVISAGMFFAYNGKKITLLSDITGHYRVSGNQHEKIANFIFPKNGYPDPKGVFENAAFLIGNEIVKSNPGTRTPLFKPVLTPMLSTLQVQQKLIEGAKTNNLQMIQEALATGADVDAKDTIDYNCNTPLIWTAIRGHREAASFLISNGANANIADASRWLPIHRSIMEGHDDITEQLIPYSYLRFRCNLQEKTPWELSRDHSTNRDIFIKINQQVEDINKKLIEGAKTNNPQMMQEALIAGADINIQETKDYNCNTPLIWAAIRGHREAVKFLINNGSDANIADASRWLPIHRSIMEGHDDITKILVDISDLRFRCNLQEKTPYELARDHNPKVFFDIISPVVEMYNELVAETAIGYYLNEQFSKALDALNELHKLKGGLTPQKHSMRGDCYRKLGHDGDAMVEYNKAIEMDSHNLLHYINFVDLFFHRGQYQECINLLNQYLSVEPNDSNAKSILNDYEAFYAVKLYESAHHDTALEYARRCLARDPSHPAANSVIATYDAAVQQQAEAAAAMKKAWGRAWAQQQMENNRNENFRRMDSERAQQSQRASISNMQMMQQANAASQASLARQTQSIKNLQTRMDNSISKFTQHNKQFISILRNNEAKGGNLASCLPGPTISTSSAVFFKPTACPNLPGWYLNADKKTCRPGPTIVGPRVLGFNK